MSTKELWDSLWRCPYLLSFYVKYILRECGTSGEDVSVNAVILLIRNGIDSKCDDMPKMHLLDKMF